MLSEPELTFVVIWHNGAYLSPEMIGVIHDLGYRVLGEGIEAQEQYDMLLEMGCDEGQGYYFAKPMPMDEFVSGYLTEV